MRIILFVAVLSISACTLPGGAKFSSDHGYCIQGQLGDSFQGSGCPTIAPEGSLPLGSRTRAADGQVLAEDMFSTVTLADGSKATGPAAVLLVETSRLQALLLICAIQPKSGACIDG